MTEPLTYTKAGADAAIAASRADLEASLPSAYAPLRTVDMLTKGAAANGTTDDWAVFTAARTEAGTKGIVHFPAKKGATTTTYYLAGVRPDLAGTQITADAGVVLKFDDCSPNIKTWKMLTPVTIENTAHASTLRKRPGIDLPLAVGLAAAGDQQDVALATVDFTSLSTFRTTDTAGAPYTSGSFTGTVATDTVSWSSSFSSGHAGVFVSAPPLGQFYEACLEDASTDAASSVGIMVLDASNNGFHVLFPNTSVVPVVGGSTTMSGLPSHPHSFPAVPGQYGLPQSSGGVVLGFRRIGTRKVEVYTNGRRLHTFNTGADIAKIGWIVSTQQSASKTIARAITYGPDYTPPNVGRCVVSVAGDSISYGAWSNLPYADLLPVAFGGLKGGGHIQVRQNLAVSGTNAGQWATPGGTYDIAQYDFTPDDYVLVMLGTNDGQALTSVSAYLGYLDYIADTIIADGAVPVFGHFPLWWSQTATGIPGAPGVVNSGRAARLRQAVAHFCAANGYPLALAHGLTGGAWDWMADNIHPNDLGSAVIARSFAEAIARHRLSA